MTLNTRRTLVRHVNTFFAQHLFGVVDPAELRFDPPTKIEFATIAERRKRTVHSKFHEIVTVRWGNGFVLAVASPDEAPPKGRVTLFVPLLGSAPIEGPIEQATWEIIADAVRSARQDITTNTPGAFLPGPSDEGALPWDAMTIS